MIPHFCICKPNFMKSAQLKAMGKPNISTITHKKSSSQQSRITIAEMHLDYSIVSCVVVFTHPYWCKSLTASSYMSSTMQTSILDCLALLNRSYSEAFILHMVWRHRRQFNTSSCTVMQSELLHRPPFLLLFQKKASGKYVSILLT